mmetsp:Transcript_30167/g.59203  ORF Transcript_30167/g.59203 Transcript_30167/m.59203 type:complete len:123 (+) Transcript_30167:323-691(+)
MMKVFQGNAAGPPFVQPSSVLTDSRKEEKDTLLSRDLSLSPYLARRCPMSGSIRNEGKILSSLLLSLMSLPFLSSYPDGWVHRFAGKAGTQVRSHRPDIFQATGRILLVCRQSSSSHANCSE